MIAQDEDLELLSEASLGVVCFSVRPAGATSDDEALEAANRRIQDQLLAEGVAMMSSTRLRGRYALRLCILNYGSTWSHVRATLDRIRTLAGEWRATR